MNEVANDRAAMPDLVELHFEELDFLWEERERVVLAPDWLLEELAELEARADAHLDGLRVAGASTIDMVAPALEGDETGAATAAAFALLASNEEDSERRVLEALVAGSPPVREGVRISLRHAPAGAWLTRLRELAHGAEPALHASIGDVLAFHRLPPTPDMEALLHDTDPEVQRLATLAVGRGAGPWDAGQLERALASGEPLLRRAALEASAKRAMPELLQTCQSLAAAADAVPEAVAFLGIFGREDDLPLLERALARPELAGAASTALGCMGRVASVPRLIDAMRDPQLRRPAGAAFQRITGAQEIDGEAPPPPADLDEDEADFWDDSPAPDADLAQAFWSAHGARFDPAGRWQAGQRVDVDPLGDGFDSLPLRVRRDVYLWARAFGSTSDLELERRAALQRGPLS